MQCKRHTQRNYPHVTTATIDMLLLSLYTDGWILIVVYNHITFIYDFSPFQMFVPGRIEIGCKFANTWIETNIHSIIRMCHAFGARKYENTRRIMSHRHSLKLCIVYVFLWIFTISVCRLDFFFSSFSFCRWVVLCMALIQCDGTVTRIWEIGRKFVDNVFGVCWPKRSEKSFHRRWNGIWNRNLNMKEKKKTRDNDKLDLNKKKIPNSIVTIM